MFYEQLKDIYQSLTYSERKIADYILANKDSIGDMTSQKMADNLGIGQATVIRFSKKLGFRNYKYMLSALEEGERNYSDIEEIQLKESTATTNEKIKNKVKFLIDFTDEANTPQTYDAAVDLIREARYIYCYGYMSTMSVAVYMHELLQLFGLNSFCMEAHSTMSSMRCQGEGGLLIVFSKSGETPITNEVVRFAKEKGLKVLAVSSYKPNSMVTKNKVDVWIKAMYSEVKTRFIHYTETIPFFYIVDCLVLNLYKRDFSHYSDNVEEHTAITKKKNVK